MQLINLNKIFVPTTGGTVNGDVEVEGAMTVNTGNGDGTTYDVASEITELKSAWDSVSQVITVRPTEDFSLGTDSAKIAMGSVYSKSGSGDIFTLEDGGIKCSKEGRVLVSANARFGNITGGDLVALRIYRDSQMMTSTYGTRTGGASTLIAIPPLLVKATEGGIFYLYACNDTAARGNIMSGVTFLTVQYVD